MVRLGPVVLGILVSILVALGVIGAMWFVLGFEAGLHGARPALVFEGAIVAVVCLALAGGLTAWAAARGAATLPSS